MVDLLDKIGAELPNILRGGHGAQFDSQSARGQDAPQDAPPDPFGKLDDGIALSPQALAAIENDPFFGLSSRTVEQLDELFNRMDAIFETAGDQPLTRQQHQQLDALDRKIQSLLGDDGTEADLFALLSDDAAERVDGLLRQAEHIFKLAGDTDFSQEQQMQLEDLDRQIQIIIQGELGGEDPFAGLPAKSLQQLDQLFSQVDLLFERNDAGPLSTGQSKMLAALERKISDIFAAHL